MTRDGDMFICVNALLTPGYNKCSADSIATGFRVLIKFKSFDVVSISSLFFVFRYVIPVRCKEIYL